MTVPFLKMHGLGNDFVVLDARRAPLQPSAGAIRRIADRRRGVGCDQLVLIAPPPDPAPGGPPDSGADAAIRFFNPDGGEAGACGNATRCVAALLMAEGGTGRVGLVTAAGLLSATRAEGGMISVDMGAARLGWAEIPLAQACDTLLLPVAWGDLAGPTAVGMGNPHAVFFVADAEAVPLAEFGPAIEHHPLFPERTNVEIVHRLGPDRLRLRVWERGVGITPACGSGACAAGVAAARRGVTGRRTEIVLDGGSLWIDWRDDGHVMMTGPVARSFSGLLAEDLWDGTADAGDK